MARNNNFLFGGFVVVIVICFSILGVASSAVAQDSSMNQNITDHEDMMYENDTAAGVMVESDTALEYSSNQEPSPPQAILGNTITIPIAAFSSDGVNPDGFFKWFSGGFVSANAAVTPCLSAPIIFPKGAATIKNVKIYAWDFNESGSAFFDLYALKLKDGTSTYLGGVTTEDSAGIEAYKIEPNAGIQAGKTYTIAMCILGEDIYFYGAKVLYAR